MIGLMDNILYRGRFDFSDSSCVKFAWPYTSINVNFKGTRIAAILESNAEDYMIVVVDGKIVNRSIRITRRSLYMLADELEDKVHKVELIKRTEGFEGTTTFYGFELFEGEVMKKPKENELKIEIIGDSISCGYGNEAESEKIPFDAKYCNSYFTYGAIAARKLKADLNITAWSGLGLVRNCNDEDKVTMPEKIDWITPINTKHKWNFNKYVPSIVVINLGTNDTNNFMPNRDLFVETYKKLINRVLGLYGDIKVICSIGPSLEGEALENLREWVSQDVVKYFNDNGNNNILFLEYEKQKSENGYGCDSHPSIKTHKIMAEKLVGIINENI